MKIAHLLACIALTAATGAHARIAQAPEASVAVPPATLLSYAGTYTTDRGMDVVIKPTLEGELTIEINSPPFRMRAISQTEFAVDEKRARVIFRTADGKVSGLTIKMGQRELHATRAQ